MVIGAMYKTKLEETKSIIHHLIFHELSCLFKILPCDIFFHMCTKNNIINPEDLSFCQKSCVVSVMLASMVRLEVKVKTT